LQGADRRVTARGKGEAFWRGVGCALSIALCLAATGPSHAAAGDARLIRLPDGRRLAFRCSGQGAPTVLLEIGFGGDSLGWSKVQRRIEGLSRVCAYDRAGAGYSDPGPLPRDAEAVARDLDAALRSGRIPGPYLVVGHSSGGLYARVFAARRRRDVVGLVLADPTVEHQDWRFAEAFGSGAGDLASIRQRVEACLTAAEGRPGATETLGSGRCVAAGPPGHAAQPVTWRTQLSELDTLMAASSEQARRTRRLNLTFPVIVLSADHTYPDPRADAFWGQLHADVAGAYPNGVVRRVDSPHMIPTERPDIVADAITELILKARRAQGARASETAR
jgi:pimeloyl-ACP methyl ester carboxylesterase